MGIYDGKWTKRDSERFDGQVAMPEDTMAGHAVFIRYGSCTPDGKEGTTKPAHSTSFAVGARVAVLGTTVETLGLLISQTKIRTA
jgi:hypothetical protein